MDAAAETLAKNDRRAWTVGRRVNLERAPKIGDELGGHIVTGHVDGVARIVARKDFDGMAHFRNPDPHELAKFIAAKGDRSALDGVADDGERGRRRQIHHPAHPAHARGDDLGRKGDGDPLNIEVDLMARYGAAGERGRRRNNRRLPQLPAASIETPQGFRRT